ncbi:MAG: D-aminoacylase, partial [Pseudolysinimonas sp.]
MAAGRALFEGVRVVDGTGAAAYTADVEVAEGRVSAIRPVAAAATPTGRRSVLTLAPGFIDMHAHSDLALLDDEAQWAKLSQGVTTQVIGQDGIGYAPVDDAALALVRQQISGWNGDLPDAAFTWRDTAAFL